MLKTAQAFYFFSPFILALDKTLKEQRLRGRLNQTHDPCVSVCVQ